MGVKLDSGHNGMAIAPLAIVFNYLAHLHMASGMPMD
jgi:hypothetical protein